MKKECKHSDCENCKWKCKPWHHHAAHNSGCGGAYFLGIIGSAVFFMGQATDFWTGVLALLKALVWPAFMVYELFKFLIG